MASKDYLEILERQMRKRTLELTYNQEKKILNTYIKLANSLSREYLSRGATGLTRLIILSKMKQCTEEIEKIIKTNAQLEAENIVNGQTKILLETFKGYELDRRFLNMVGRVPRDCVNYMIKGNLYKNGKGLSERLWHTGKVGSETIQDVLVQSRLMGLGAVETAKLLNTFVRGDKVAWAKANDKLGASYGSKIKANNITYNSIRLARTFIAHTSQVTLIESTRMNPFVTKLKWHTSNSDRKCDKCKALDGKIFNKDDCPFDHPNGMCYQTAVIPDSPEDIGRAVGEWVNGGQNKALDKWARQMGYSDTSIVKPK